MELIKDDQKAQVKKKPLGRGLGSLLGDFDTNNMSNSPVVTQKPVEKIETKTAPIIQQQPVTTPVIENKTNELSEDRVWYLGIEKVFPNKNQPRKEFDKIALEELANSIKSHGIIQPITVRALEKGEFQIIAGERRWRAAQLAGLHQVPVLIKKTDDKKTLEFALVENIQRKDLNPIEEAEALRYMMETHSYSQQDLATIISKERSTITNLLRLLTLPIKIREWIVEGALTTGHAKVLLSLDSQDSQISLAQKVVNQSWSVRKLEKEIKSQSSDNVETSATYDDGKAIQLKAIVENLQKKLGTKVAIDYSNGQGRLSMYFNNDDEFNYLVELISEV